MQLDYTLTALIAVALLLALIAFELLKLRTAAGHISRGINAAADDTDSDEALTQIRVTVQQCVSVLRQLADQGSDQAAILSAIKNRTELGLTHITDQLAEHLALALEQQDATNTYREGLSQSVDDLHQATGRVATTQLDLMDAAGTHTRALSKIMDRAPAPRPWSNCTDAELTALIGELARILSLRVAKVQS